VSARHLENVWDWKSFITPHLLTRGDTITGITFPHHMRFYMENGVTRVQYKHFSKDAWGLMHTRVYHFSCPGALFMHNS
jgi:hypothetical protein